MPKTERNKWESHPVLHDSSGTDVCVTCLLCQEGMKETLETWSMKVRILFIFFLPFSHSFYFYFVEIYLNIIYLYWSLQLKNFGMCISGPIGKELACQCRRHKRCGFNSWVRKILWRREWQSTPVFWPEEYGQRSLTEYNLWSHKKSDMTEATYMYAPISAARNEDRENIPYLATKKDYLCPFLITPFASFTTSLPNPRQTMTYFLPRC